MDAQRIRAEVEKAVEAAWERIAKPVPPGADNPGSPGWTWWEFRVSPPFPRRWPPDGTGSVCYYAHAAGHQMSLRDGELLGPVWARITVSAKAESPLRVEILTSAISAVGFIGVRPLAQEELLVYQQRDALEREIVAASCRTDPQGSDRAAIGLYLRAWSRDAGIGEQIRGLHSTFFEWFSCPSVSESP